MVQHAAADSFPRRSPEYSEVALPLHVSQVFTYRLPEPLRAVAQAGARVVVPVGRKLSTGFIVSLTNSLPGLDLKREDIKDKVINPLNAILTQNAKLPKNGSLPIAQATASVQLKATDAPAGTGGAYQ